MSDLCVALYKLTGGRPGRWRMLTSVASRMNVSFADAEARAKLAAAERLVTYEPAVGSILLEQAGRVLGAPKPGRLARRAV